MKTLKAAIAGLILAAAVAMPLLIRHRGEAALRVKNATLRQHAGLVAKLLAENQSLSNAVTQMKSSQSLTDTELMEVMRLRDEIGQLRRTLRGMDYLQRETDRLRDALQNQAGEQRNAGDVATALLADQMGLRQARVSQLKEWLEEMPEEKIPELQFLSEDSWVRSAEWPRVTDEEYRQWMTAQRGNAEMRFSSMAFKALKQYAQANDGQFPTDLSQLKPYFESPIDDAILQRYEIVPAKSLIKFLAEAGGEWVITQKAPVNKSDVRVAIGVKGDRGTVQERRWDPVP